MSASRNADRLDRKLFPYTQKRLELDGHELAYVDEGKGPPLLMLHGNPTCRRLRVTPASLRANGRR